MRLTSAASDSRSWTAARISLSARERLTSSLFVAGSPLSGQLLVQAAIVQIYALLSSPPSTYFCFTWYCAGAKAFTEVAHTHAATSKITSCFRISFTSLCR